VHCAGLYPSKKRIKSIGQRLAFMQARRSTSPSPCLAGTPWAWFY
jgi:hypothetical protein